MSSQEEPSGVVNGGRPVASAVKSFGVAAEEFSTASALLAQGVLVTFRPYKKGGSSPQDGNLQFDGEGTLMFFPVNKKQRQKQGPTKTMVTSINEVLLEPGGEGNVCRILLKESATGSSFSFQCAADAEGFSRSYLTKFVAAVLREALPPAQKKGDLLEKARRMTTFAELLEPLGLVDKYGSEFQQCGILFENLSVVTREDLAEVVGITNRVDQINIMGQIKRCFRDPPPERHSCGCSDSNRGSRGQSFGFETGKVAAEMIGALASL